MGRVPHRSYLNGTIAYLLSALIALALSAAPASAADGTWNRAWGKDVDTLVGTGYEICTIAANCKVGSNGGLGGEFNFANGVDIGPDGSVYVVDQYRIQKFDAAGNFLRTWGKDVIASGMPGDTGIGFEICTVQSNCKAASNQAGPGGEMGITTGIAVDDGGRVYVATLGANRVEKFDSQGNFISAWGKDVVTGGGTGYEVCTAAASCKIGATGTAGGELSGPADIAVSDTGFAYVADEGNHRIQQFETGGAGAGGTFSRTWGKDVFSGGGAGAEVCDVAATCQGGSLGNLGGEFGGSLNAVAVDPSGNVYTTGSNTNQRVDKFSSAGTWLRGWGKNVEQAGGTGPEICTVASACKVGEQGVLGGDLNNPNGLATDANGLVYVAAGSNNRIDRFDAQGNFQRAWGTDVDSAAAGTGYEICTVATNCKNGTSTAVGGSFNAIQDVGVGTETRRLYSTDSTRVQLFEDPLPPDSDGDGVPDASDACPTVAGPASNGGCPVTTTPPTNPPGGDDACEKAKGKLAKAKKKLKKLKAGDASKAKVKKAKAKVKKAKAAVKKAC